MKEGEKFCAKRGISALFSNWFSFDFTLERDDTGQAFLALAISPRACQNLSMLCFDKKAL